MALVSTALTKGCIFFAFGLHLFSRRFQDLVLQLNLGSTRGRGRQLTDGSRTRWVMSLVGEIGLCLRAERCALKSREDRIGECREIVRPVQGDGFRKYCYEY